MEALVEAAEKWKEVIVLVELRARFVKKIILNGPEDWKMPDVR